MEQDDSYYQREVDGTWHVHYWSHDLKAWTSAPVALPPSSWFVHYDFAGERWIDQQGEAHHIDLPGVPPKPTAGRKDDQGKPQPSLLPPRPLMLIAAVLTFGARKYERDNWQRVEDARHRYADALLRHVFAWLGGEALDPESGHHHLAHAGCCILFLLHFEVAHDEP